MIKAIRAAQPETGLKKLTTVVCNTSEYRGAKKDLLRITLNRQY